MKKQREKLSVDQSDSFVEHCWILLGRQRAPIVLARKVRPTTGKPNEVKFDATSVIRHEEQRVAGEESVVGFLHTHPGGSLKPSHRDVETMRAWTSCLGKHLYCLIAWEDRLAAYRFDNDESVGELITVCEIFADDQIVIVDPSKEKR